MRRQYFDYRPRTQFTVRGDRLDQMVWETRRLGQTNPRQRQLRGLFWPNEPEPVQPGVTCAQLHSGYVGAGLKPAPTVSEPS
jgi:hypothetical protein